MKLIVLGSGCCIPHHKRKSPGYWLETEHLRLLIDCGSGTLGRIADAGLDYTAIDLILVSHLHIDHSGDLISILFALRNSERVVSESLEIIGPEGFSEHFRLLSSLYGDWINPTRPKVEVKEARENLEKKDVRIGFFPLQHSVPTLGFRIESPDGVFAYGADSGFCDALIELGRDSDLFLLECSFPDGKQAPGHLTPSLAGRAAHESGAKHLALAHFYPETDPVPAKKTCAKRFSGKITALEDGMTILLPPTPQVKK